MRSICQRKYGARVTYQHPQASPGQGAIVLLLSVFVETFSLARWYQKVIDASWVIVAGEVRHSWLILGFIPYVCDYWSEEYPSFHTNTSSRKSQNFNCYNISVTNVNQLSSQNLSWNSSRSFIGQQSCKISQEARQWFIRNA